MPVKESKTARIKQMLAEGMAPTAIAKKVKTSRNYVYYVRWNDVKKGKKVAAKNKVKAAKALSNILTAENELDTQAQQPEPQARTQVQTWRVVSEQVDPRDVQVGGNHYKNMVIQPAEYCHRNNIGKLEGDVIYYTSRWRTKGGVEDLEKAKHTLDLMIQFEQGHAAA